MSAPCLYPYNEYNYITQWNDCKFISVLEKKKSLWLFSLSVKLSVSLCKSYKIYTGKSINLSH